MISHTHCKYNTPNKSYHDLHEGAFNVGTMALAHLLYQG